MFLRGTGGQTLELRFAGYESERASARIDPAWRWLVVIGNASDGTRRWQFRDACLRPNECADLADWLDAVADRRQDLAPTHFFEPELEFQSISDLWIRVIFRFEARPPWTNEDGDAFWLDFATSPESFREVACDLREDVRSYLTPSPDPGGPT